MSNSEKFPLAGERVRKSPLRVVSVPLPRTLDERTTVTLPRCLKALSATLTSRPATPRSIRTVARRSPLVAVTSYVPITSDPKAKCPRLSVVARWMILLPATVTLAPPTPAPSNVTVPVRYPLPAAEAIPPADTERPATIVAIAARRKKTQIICYSEPNASSRAKCVACPQGVLGQEEVRPESRRRTISEGGRRAPLRARRNAPSAVLEERHGRIARASRLDEPNQRKREIEDAPFADGNGDRPGKRGDRCCRDPECHISALKRGTLTDLRDREKRELCKKRQCDEACAAAAQRQRGDQIRDRGRAACARRRSQSKRECRKRSKCENREIKMAQRECDVGVVAPTESKKLGRQMRHDSEGNRQRSKGRESPPARRSHGPDICKSFANPSGPMAIQNSARRVYATATRRAILDLLKSEQRYLTAAAIYTRVQKTNTKVALSTVYRTLELLTRLGTISSRAEGGGEAGYIFCTN